MRIIINADDFGLSTEINETIFYCFKNKLISSATMMTNMPSVWEAIKIVNENNLYNCIGLHFNIIEGTPLTHNIKKCNRICNKNGEFSYTRNKIWLWTKIEKQCIKEELNAQINILKKNNISISHFDSHMHVHTEIFLFLILMKVLKKHNIYKIRIARTHLHRQINLKYLYKFIFNKILKLLGFKTTKEFNSLFDIYATNSKTIELMCHPKKIIKNNVIDGSGEKIIPLLGELISYNQL